LQAGDVGAVYFFSGGDTYCMALVHQLRCRCFRVVRIACRGPLAVQDRRRHLPFARVSSTRLRLVNLSNLIKIFKISWVGLLLVDFLGFGLHAVGFIQELPKAALIEIDVGYRRE